MYGVHICTLLTCDSGNFRKVHRINFLLYFFSTHIPIICTPIITVLSLQYTYNRLPAVYLQIQPLAIFFLVLNPDKESFVHLCLCPENHGDSLIVYCKSKVIF